MGIVGIVCLLSGLFVINTVIHPNNTSLPLYAFDIHIPSRYMLALQPGPINKIGLNGLLQLELRSEDDKGIMRSLPLKSSYLFSESVFPNVNLTSELFTSLVSIREGFKKKIKIKSGNFP